MDGLLLVDKPAGWTSHDVVAKMRGILKIRAIGHAGTLDPFATGLLVLGIGKGTKALTALVGVDKEYEAVIRLGATSDTFDKEGVITVGANLAFAPPTGRSPTGRSPTEKPPTGQSPTGHSPTEKPPTGRSPTGRSQGSPLRDDIERALDKFRNGYEQFAPLHSAKKINGQKLYDLARAGKATEEMRPKKRIQIYDLRLSTYEWPNLAIHVKCGSGTYIRSLADDIGRELGVGGYCVELRRTKVGDFDVKHALSMDGITKGTAESALIHLPVDKSSKV